jgi:hypothetical protein
METTQMGAAKMEWARPVRLSKIYFIELLLVRVERREMECDRDKSISHRIET